jgi:AAA domain
MSVRNRSEGKQSYDVRRRMYTKLLKDKDAIMNNDRDAKRFMEGMATFDEKADLLLSLTDPTTFGLKRIRDILSFVGSIHNVQDLVIPLLQHIMHAECARPLNLEMRNKILAAIVGVPGFLHALEAFEVAKHLSVVHVTLLCSFLIASTRALLEARISPSIIAIAKAIKDRGDIQESKILCAIILVDEPAQIKKTFASTGTKNNKDVAIWVTDAVPPGGRHDNDHVNYRNIQVVPTAEELRSQLKPYLPLANGGNAIFQDPCTKLLDSNFRLLREDAVHTMRQNILNQERAWPNARIVGLHCGRAKGKGSDSVFFLVQCDCPKSINWERSRLLLEGSVIVFCTDGAPVRLGTIVYRECGPEWMDCKSGPRFGVLFESEDDFVLHNQWKNKSLGELKQGGANQQNVEAVLRQMTTYDLIEASKSFFSYRPILKTLQKMDRVPLLDELTTPNRAVYPAPLGYLPKRMNYPGTTVQCNLESWNSEFLCSKTTLDPSQADALHHAFTSRIALIQGPPGTGKTFIGSLMARMIRENTDETILCVCYTNHALDQFLEHMLDFGESRIVRIGGKSKSDRLEKFNIRNLARQKSDHVEQIGFNIKKLDALIHEQKERLDERMKQIETEITWNEIKDYLQYEFPDTLQFLTLPHVDDGFIIKGRRGKDADESWLWTLWSKGKDFPKQLDDYYDYISPNFFRFWQMPLHSRIELIGEWRTNILSDMTGGIYESVNKLNELQKTKESYYQEKQLQILKEARIIGATTSGAAIHKPILDEVAASVVLVEEAGEVLESHILTSLSLADLNNSNGTKHLILIGDHKQLRPKVEDYTLTTVSENGYNLDCSLFERLVLTGRPSASLAVQHRMRPCISAIIRKQTYPFLEDHPSVRQFPNVKGVTQDMVFLNHNFLEDNAKSTKFGVSDTSTSKSNTQEAHLTLCVVRYLLLQGYQTSQIVVLTPYLGQLMKISRLVSENLKEIGALIDEKDQNDIGDLDPEMYDLVREKKSVPSLRCSSVDNFQGEESDIVVISLVRSNKHGGIGFLKEEQRVNVMLSRARHGMIVIGNADTLRTSGRGKDVWEPILQTFHENGQLLIGLPTICQIHPNDDPIMLQSVLDFQTLRPNGGCQRKCNYRLICGHVCPQMCHPIDRDHQVAQVNCTQPCRRFPPDCERSHPCRKLCNEKCGPCTINVAPFELPCGHTTNFASCHETRQESILKVLQPRCKFKLSHTYPSCGHCVETTCGNTLSISPKCPSMCGVLLPCGHTCSDG